MIDNALFSQLLHTLNKINFSHKYYSFYENANNQISQINDKKKFDKQDFNEILVSTNLNFKYQAKENFFTYEEKESDYILVLKIAFSSSYIEAILSIKNGEETASSPFPKLARESAQLSDPSFSYSPTSPKIPFCNRTSLETGIKFIISLFEEIKHEFLC